MPKKRIHLLLTFICTYDILKANKEKPTTAEGESKMKSFYADLIEWNLPSSRREDAEELAHYVGHELAERELTGEELEKELKASYHELKELHAESNITISEWVQWVREGIKEYQSWLEER